MTLLALPTTARGLCAEVARRLDAAGVGSPNAEARDLVAAVLGRPRLWPVLHAQDTLGLDTADAVLADAEHRAAGMPFAYAVGRAAFRYLTLIVDRRVLIPRQETEYLVD
ncbi:MAG: peptide chain release factor N(5)-glutamine methyltransferase, partial [Gemmatimonadaceae bacterium]